MQKTKVASRNKMISVISNKGGVGKTVLSIELANILGQNEKKVLLIDTDLHTGDIANKLSLKPKKTLLDYFEKNRDDLHDLVVPCHHFELLPSTGSHIRFANLNYVQKMKFINAFREIAEDYDYTILDLSAGIARTTLDFALIADFTLVVTTPEDVQTGYGCAKAAAERLQELEQRYLKKNPEYHNYDLFSPLFVFNKSDRETAMNMFTGVLRASVITQQSHGIIFRPRYLGYIQTDTKLISRSYTQLHMPVSETAPNSNTGTSFLSVAQFFINSAIHQKRRTRQNPLSKIFKLFHNEQDNLIAEAN